MKKLIAVEYSPLSISKLVQALTIAKEALEKITCAYEAEVYSLSDAIMISEDALNDIDKIEKGVTI